MIKYVIDASAWIEYLDGTEEGKEVEKILQSESDVYANIITLTEVIGIAKKKSKDTTVVFESLTSLSKIFQIDNLFAKEAGELHEELKKKSKNISYGDVFVVLTAQRLGAKIITKDPDFKGVKNAIFISKNK